MFDTTNNSKSKKNSIMKKLTLLFVLLVVITSCKEKTETPTVNYEEQNLDVTTSIYPKDITRVFDAHGGLDNWKQMRTLEFSMEKPDGLEITTTDLRERYSLIEMPKHTIGFDGESVWMKSKDKSVYKGNPKFYYNLMFYFYAMPFILADDGIKYTDADPLVFEGKSYPGIKISYEAGVGVSPDDEYVMYYDSETNKMTWLAYTVTYFSKEKSEKWSFINYSDWQEVEGLLMPKTLSWYNVENNLPTTKRNDVEFSHIMMTTDKMSLKMYMMPDDAEVVQ